MYGGIAELMKNRQYYYYSSVGPEYSHWTEEGNQALLDYMNLISFKMIEAENNELNERSKQMVLKTLKGEKA